MRQRALTRLEAFVTTAEESNQLPALRGMAGRLLEILRNAWSDVIAAPLYPAFLHK
jgi:hypothetical protein